MVADNQPARPAAAAAGVHGADADRRSQSAANRPQPPASDARHRHRASSTTPSSATFPYRQLHDGTRRSTPCPAATAPATSRCSIRRCRRPAALVWRNDPAAFEDFPEFFLAHELAHQWWGQAVGWRNYHEQWLSEGFAQYFAAMYAEHQRGAGRRSARVLRHMRKWAVDASPQGPVYLGYRLGHIRNEGRVYRALVYNKGARGPAHAAAAGRRRRVLRRPTPFLRRLALPEGGHRRSPRCHGSQLGQALGRFFERWIYATALPTATLSTRVENGPGGPRLAIRVEQVRRAFRLPADPEPDVQRPTPSVNVAVPVTEKVDETTVPLAGTLREVEIDRDDGDCWPRCSASPDSRRASRIWHATTAIGMIDSPWTPSH